MRPIMICVVIAFVLTALLAPSLVLAGDPPDYIIVNPGDPPDTIVVSPNEGEVMITNYEFNIGPPDLGVKTPDGSSRPPEGIPPGT